MEKHAHFDDQNLEIEEMPRRLVTDPSYPYGGNAGVLDFCPLGPPSATIQHSCTQDEDELYDNSP